MYITPKYGLFIIEIYIGDIEHHIILVHIIHVISILRYGNILIWKYTLEVFCFLCSRISKLTLLREHIAYLFQ